MHVKTNDKIKTCSQCQYNSDTVRELADDFSLDYIASYSTLHSIIKQYPVSHVRLQVSNCKKYISRLVVIKRMHYCRFFEVFSPCDWRQILFGIAES